MDFKSELRTVECGPCTWFNYCSSFLWFLHICRKGKEQWTCSHVKLKELHFLLFHFHILLSVCWELHKNRILSVFLIMCTIGSVGRVLAYSIGQYVNRHSVNPQSKVSRHISWLSVEYRVLLSIGWLSVNDLYFEHQCIGQYRVNGISVTCRWYMLVWCRHNLKYYLLVDK